MIGCERGFGIQKYGTQSMSSKTRLDMSNYDVQSGQMVKGYPKYIA
jgi:hypothetical protein